MTARRPAQPAVSTSPLREISLFVLCHEWLVALDADSVERIVPMSEELSLTAANEPHTRGFAGMLNCAGQTIPAWDLGRVLGLGDVNDAWVLLRREQRRLALRTGVCLRVEALPRADIFALPPGIFATGERSLFTGAFHAQAHLPPGKQAQFAGLVFDLSVLGA